MSDASLKKFEILKDKLVHIKRKKKIPNNIIDIREGYNKRFERNNKRYENNKNYKKNKKEHFKINAKFIATSVVAVIFLIFIIWAVFHKNAYEVYIGDISVGVIKQEGLERDILNTAKAQIESTEGTTIKLDEKYSTVTSKFVRASKKDIVTTDYIISQVKDKISYSIEASMMSIGDAEIGILKNEAEIEATKKRILDEYTLENAQIVSKSFVEDDEIKITKKFVNKNEIINSEDLYAKLTQQIEVPKKYNVKSGDSLWMIASNNSLSQSQMLKINPGITENTVLKIGQELNLVVPKPVLSVKLVSEIKYNEVIPHSVEYQTDDSQYKTFKKTTQEGKDGNKEVTAHIIYINGYEEDREIVGEPVITVEPVPSIIVTGTKSLPPKSATGSFRRPISGGTISSYFGSRWGSTHNALDIAAPGGTTIYASDGGTVKTAGWNGSYGNLVVIDHGNGFETYYGHCSRIDVKVGQKVAKSEKISAVGSTGNSTGNHVHFEVRKDGTPMNPLNYIK